MVICNIKITLTFSDFPGKGKGLHTSRQSMRSRPHATACPSEKTTVTEEKGRNTGGEAFGEVGGKSRGAAEGETEEAGKVLG